MRRMNRRKRSEANPVDGCCRKSDVKPLYRIQAVKKAETRVKKIALFVEMLERHERVHP